MHLGCVNSAGLRELNFGRNLGYFMEKSTFVQSQTRYISQISSKLLPRSPHTQAAWREIKKYRGNHILSSADHLVLTVQIKRMTPRHQEAFETSELQFQSS